MRILHTEASSGWGGQEIRILTESQVLMQHGHEVFVAADVGSQLIQKAAQYGVKAYAIKLKKKRWADFLALRSLIVELKPDVVSCHSSTDHWLTALARFGLKHKPAIVRTRHISTKVTRNKSTRWLYNKGTEAIMTTSESIRDDLLSDAFVAKEVIFSVPTGIDTARFVPADKAKVRQQLGLPEKHFIFGIVATLRSWKGHSYLIQAFDQLNNPNITLLIVGDGPQLHKLKQLAAQSRYSQNILFVGNQSDVLPYLQSLDCFVLPSYANEGVPQALLQAMSVGMPLISCPIGGIPETVKDYAQAKLVTAESVVHLLDAMQEQIAGAAKMVCQPYTPFTLEKMYQSVTKVYTLSQSLLLKRG